MHVHVSTVVHAHVYIVCLNCLYSFYFFNFQFFFSEQDVGKNCADVSRPKLAELNNYVPVDVLQGSLSVDSLAKFQVIQILHYYTCTCVH